MINTVNRMTLGLKSDDIRTFFFNVFHLDVVNFLALFRGHSLQNWNLYIRNCPGIFPDQNSSTAAIIWVHEKANLSYKSFLFLLRFKILLRLSTPKSSSSPLTSSPHGESLFCLHSNMKPTNHDLTYLAVGCKDPQPDYCLYVSFWDWAPIWAIRKPEHVRARGEAYALAQSPISLTWPIKHLSCFWSGWEVLDPRWKRPWMELHKRGNYFCH